MPRISKTTDVRKSEIMDAAEELFKTEGFEQTAVSDIVRKVGVAQGLFYYYFRSKEEILNEILERYVDRYEVTLNDIVRGPGTAVEKLGRIVGAFNIEIESENILEYVHRKENIAMHSLLALKVIERFVPVLEAVFRQGINEGIFHTEYPREIAEYLLAGGGFLHTYRFGGTDKTERYFKLRAGADILEKALGAKEGTLSGLVSRG